MSDEIKLIIDGNGVVVDWDERDLDPDQHERLETFFPISSVREKLLSDELVEAVAKAEYEEDLGREWPPVMDYQKDEWLNDARASLTFAAAAFLQEEEG